MISEIPLTSQDLPQGHSIDILVQTSHWHPRINHRDILMVSIVKGDTNHNRYLDFSIDYNEAKIVLFLLPLITLTLFQRVRS